ncbi:tryptophan synthase subunit alpha [Brachyspira murdochii]|uniref:Tryptophan synthase alpha chain n=1 Tax=Brachyspira murdochii (strain ATCC 51284 / DSM 12563 / 56-150) TaxID=526224 RepID=D5U421_BRAM5|nr:tryptophan synthase subunit alpha [Brachyspira murdochii]ADG72202.1 tryptophan synthase, alpha subunit [Brachyspira murdochii DSM 12563]
MSNIYKAFENKKAFIPFITCGYPSLELTEDIIYSMIENGADLIELGIPFSDPTAEGLVIQNANEKALKNHVTREKIFDMVRRIRKNSDIPLVFMTYANVVYSYDIENFLSISKEINIDGLILPDVPFEEKNIFEPFCKKYDIDLISLIAPTSENRIHKISKEASGFVYCVSSLGVTGVRQKIETDIAKIVDLIKKNTNIPAAVGFGISTTEQAKNISKYSDGVIVGSAIIKLCDKYENNSPKYIGEYVRDMKNAMNE